MRLFSVVIPILNMEGFVRQVAGTLAAAPFGDLVEEIIFVCDRSIDGTEEKIKELQQNPVPGFPKIILVQPEVKRGHFQARYLGAKAATCEKVFFIDARVTLNRDSVLKLKSLAAQYPAMCANIDIDVNKNIFCLYWQRSHETIFGRTYKANQGINVIRAENYDQMRIGTTCFFCSRDHFVKVCEKYLGKRIYSDDTLVQKDLVALEPITLHPDFRVWWEPRNNLKAFLKHLYIRGPGFAEYHIFKKRGWLFWAFLSGLILLVAEITLLFLNPVLALIIAVTGLAVMALTAVPMAKSFREFLLIAPLHVASMIAYGVGAINGVKIVLKNKKAGTSV